MTIWVGGCSRGGGSSGGGDLDRFAPKYLVGNTTNGDPDTSSITGLADGFTYIADIGNGAGIATALSLAAAVPGDIWVRPGTYNFTQPLAPAAALTVPTGVRLIGSGPSTILTGRLTGDQTLFNLAASSEMHNLRINVIGVQSGTGPGVVNITAGSSAVCWISRVDVQVEITAGSTGTLRTAFNLANGVSIIQDCRFFLAGTAVNVGTGGLCAVLSNGGAGANARITRCRVGLGGDTGFVALNNSSLNLSESTVGTDLSTALPTTAAVLMSGGSASGQLLISECDLQAALVAGVPVVSADAAFLRIAQSRLGPVASVSTFGAFALISTSARGVVVGNQLSGGNIDTSGGSNHIVTNNLIRSTATQTYSGTDEVAHNITF